ncbi:MAG: DUF91 domain-containing protein [Chloroflexi bacterium]|nr:MAG: DUF91 domain-containing protein [Chloroflexota bacterium]MBL1194972.1 DUF91 domain-containing protein [Chloroflexota bacterium]NOH12261.1 DUF91 domain-containing protein [Chloroflexota bacterium]
MPIYRIDAKNTIHKVRPSAFDTEKVLQQLFEANLEELLGVRFIATEFTTGDRQRGRIDTLGLDQDNSPTIIEYKRTSKENIINQGLFYLDWLVDHKGDFTMAAQKALGEEIEMDWSSPRLILIAETFSEYDQYAVNRIGANVELWTYQRYADDLLLLEAIFVTQAREHSKSTTKEKREKPAKAHPLTVQDHLEGKPQEILELFQELREQVLALAGENEILEKANKNYVVYKHGKNFCEVWIQAAALKLWLDISIEDLDDPYEMARDVSEIGHWGTGDVEVSISDLSEMEKLMHLVEQSYRQTV